MNYFVLFNCRI